MPVEYIESQRGFKKLIEGGYCFTRERFSDLNLGKITWECEQRKHLCKARVHTISDEIVYRVGEHTHPPDHTRIHAARVMSEVRIRANTTNDSTDLIVKDAFDSLPHEVVMSMPSQASLRRTIQRYRAAKSAPVSAEKDFDQSINFASQQGVFGEVRLECRYTGSTLEVRVSICLAI